MKILLDFAISTTNKMAFSKNENKKIRKKIRQFYFSILRNYFSV